MEIRLDYTPQPRQALMHASPCRMILYGGAAGGGKSHSLRYDAITSCLQNPGLRAYLFRRTYKELEDNHIIPIQAEMPKELGNYLEGKKRFDFGNGSMLHFCYCENEQDVTRYQGGELHYLGVDEASHFSEYQLRYLITRNRLGGFKSQEKHLPRVVLCSNPGGVGHDFLKAKFIDPAPPETVFIDEEWGFPAIYIPAKMQDNRYLDKGYERQFQGLPPELVSALVEGDWDAIVGKALHSLNRHDHMLPQFVPPRHWTHFMSLDWGTAKPFSVGWWVVSEGLSVEDRKQDRTWWVPEGALVRYAEWYGGNRNQGLRLESPVVAKEILRLEEERGDPPMDYRIADAAMWNKMDGPSIAERMRSVDPRMSLRPSKKNREMGYAEILARLKGEETEDGYLPMLYAMDNCRQWWRTMTTLTLDPNDPEKGPDTRQDDHCYDDTAYACMSRPYVTTEDDRWKAENREELERIKGGIDPYST